MRRFRLPRTLLLATLHASTVPAQVPEGWIAFSGTSTLTGLHVLPPRVPATPVPITGLPPELVLTLNVSRGCSAFTILPNGDLVGGNLAIRSGDAVALHVLQLIGTQVQSSQRYLIGTATTSNSSISAIAPLRDGRAVFLVNESLSGSVISPSRVGLLDPVAGTVTRISTTLSGNTNALAVDEALGVIYVGVWTGTTSGVLWRVPLTGGTPTNLGSVPGGVSGLSCMSDGRLLVGLLNVTPGLGVFDPSNGSYTPIANAPHACAATTQEIATGHRMFATTSKVGYLDANGTEVTLLPFHSGVITALDVQDSPRNFGMPSPGAATHTWVTSPSPGGLPLLGNAGFHLTLATNGPPSPAVVLLSPSRATLPILGITLLVDPLAAFSVPIPAGLSIAIPIPIPADPALAGAVLHAQSIHIETGGFAASNGVTFGVIVP